MALTIEFSRRSTIQLQKILTFYDERNGSDLYSRRLGRCVVRGLATFAPNPQPAAHRQEMMCVSSI